MEMLPLQLRSKLVSMGQQVDLEYENALHHEGKEMDHVYFPYSGFVSLVASVDNHPAVKMTLIGKEGMLGATLVAGISLAPLRAVVQSAGCALQINTAAFQRELLCSETLRQVVDKYLYLLLVQLSTTAACKGFHAVRPRLANRLLATHDRVETDSFHSTHQSLADMLGVRRSAVTIAAGLLQQENCISYSRGTITIVDRRALEAASCSCYKLLIQKTMSAVPALKPAA
ncbi:MAG: Crp/Fnr family transcriptional regulator [Pseudohongiellaceae bacterium]